MKILHCADLHLGVETYGRIDPATGLSSRLLDFLSTLDQVVDYALANKVDLVLFCGDAYKSREPSQTQQREFARRINRLATSGIAVFLLVGNHDDGIYLYLKGKAQDASRGEKVLALLHQNGGNNSGIRIGAVDEMGNVHPDQFWRNVTLGNVRQRPFGDIWMDTSNPIMAGLKHRKGLLKGRCAKCLYIDACNGNLRARAEAVFNDMWMEDPACYLTDEEIGIS